MNRLHTTLWGFVLFGLTVSAHAVPVTHTPASGTNPTPASPPNGAAVATVGTRYVAFGVDYTVGNSEAVFNDPPLAFGGINGSNNVDLITPVTARIVLLNTTTQGLTSSVSVLAGGVDAPNDLLLRAFNASNALLASVNNTESGTSTLTITRPSADIAFFTVSTPTNNSFGVRQVTIETPVAVPEPAALACLALGATGLLRRRRV